MLDSEEKTDQLLRIGRGSFYAATYGDETESGGICEASGNAHEVGDDF